MHKKTLQIFLILLLILSGLAIYLNSLEGQFVWDDNQLIIQNKYITSFKYLPKIFSSDLFHFGYLSGNFYRPLQTLSYVLDYHIWKLNPFGYHLTNVILHIFVGVSLFFLIDTLFNNRLIAFFTSILFIMHPIHTESVAYISGRADMLVAFFIILSLIAFINGIKKFLNKPLYLLSIILFVAALLSKEIAIIAPFLYLSYIKLFHKEKTRKKLSLFTVPFFILSILYVILRLTMFNFNNSPLFSSSASLLTNLYFIPRILLDYFRLLFFPFNLHMERAISPLTFSEIIFSIIAFAAIILLFLNALKNNLYKIKTIYFLLWFFILLLPVLNIIPINANIAEHWLYLPSIPIFTLVGVLLTDCIAKFKKYIIYPAIAILILPYAIATTKYNTFWHDNYILYNRILSLSPNSAKIHLNLGKLYDSKQQYAKAMFEYKEAIRINPDYAVAYNNLGAVLDKQNRTEEAISNYRSAININPNFAEAYNNLGTVYRRMGLLNEAIAEYEKSLKIKPNYAEAYNNLGMTYYQKGDLVSADENYKKAIKLAPYLAEAYNNLGVVYIKNGLAENARQCWEKALDINPNYKSPRENLKRLEMINNQ